MEGNCKNCNTEVTQNYCPNCGEAVHLKRINSHYIIHEIEHVLHFEKGILYTVRELLTKPGESIRHFITENRNRLVKPIIFIIVTSLIYTLISHFFHIEDEYVAFYEKTQSTAGSMMSWVQSHYGYGNIIMGVFIAAWLKIFFGKYDYNFFEILILLCFVIGTGMLIYAFFAALQGVTHYKLMSIAGVIGFAYTTWAIGQFFDKKKPWSYVKAFVSYILGMMTAFMFVFGIGTLIDLVIKH